LSPRARRFAIASFVAVAAAAAAFLVRTDKSQWDLKVYMACARTLAGGGDPYAIQPVVDNSRFQCLYPPLIIDMYRPLAASSSAFGGDAGERFWAAMKLLALFVILWLWREAILPKRGTGIDAWRLLFVVIAYGDPFWSDFRSGNAGSFEHVLLWGALAAFVAGRDFWFATLLAAAVQPKLLPFAFLPLLVAKPRPNARAFLWGGALAAVFFSLNEWAHPGLTREFFRQLVDPLQAWHYERGPNNVSFVGLLQHCFETAWGDRQLAVHWAGRVNAAWTAAVVAATGLSLRRLWRAPGDETSKRRRSVLLYAAAYGLIVPRLKDYSFLLLIPSTLAAIESDAPPAARLLVLAFALLNSTKALAEKAGLGEWSLFAGYFKLYAVMGAWAILAFPRRRKA
jgi:hypothetical protein